MRGKLRQFPEIVKAEISRKQQRAFFQALPSFDQYVALQHAIEDAGGAIQMFHPRYLVPRAYYAGLGVWERTPEKTAALEEKLKAVPGVRAVIIDPDRWFRNERGLDVGGAVVFADPSPALEWRLIEAAKSAGFLYESKSHGHDEETSVEWSEMNHAFAGLCLIFLSIFGMLQVGLPRPPALVKYGTTAVWLALFLFLFIRSDRSSWPMGPISWWEGFREWETVQHRIGIGLVLLIAAGDFLRLKNGWRLNPVLSRWGTLAIGAAGCGMLFTHLHTTLDPAHYAMVARMNAQHIAMGVIAALFCLSKFAWETWQVPKRGGQYLWLTWLGLLGVLLTLYVE